MNYRQSALAATEFRLCVECCRWTFAGGDGRPVAELASRADWDRFLCLARRHRVQALVWHCLDSLAIDVPTAVSRQLSDDAAGIVEHNLFAASASRRLLDAFGEAGIDLVFIKGLTLAALAYPNPFLKMSWDVDILVGPETVADAAIVLEGHGYDLRVPSKAPEQWHKTRKESLWVGPGGLHLELHSRLADNMALLPALDTASPRQEVEISPGLVLPTLHDRELFAYLCVHGASSAWFRLKWVTDLAALLRGRSAEQIGELYRGSQELGAGRAAAQALLLANRIYGTPLDQDLQQELERDRRVHWLAQAACLALAHPGEPTKRRLGTFTIHWTQLFLRPGLAFKWGELRRQLADAAGNRR